MLEIDLSLKDLVIDLLALGKDQLLNLLNLLEHLTGFLIQVL